MSRYQVGPYGDYSPVQRRPPVVISPGMVRGALRVGRYLGDKVVNYFSRPSGKRQRSDDSSNSNRSARRGTNNVTFQHDYAHIYSRGRRSRAAVRRDRFRQYVFDKQLVASLAQKTWVRSALFQSGLITPTSVGNCQSVFTCGLYGGITTGTSNTWGDLFDIAAAVGAGLDDVTGKLWFNSGCMDLQIKNTTGEVGESVDPHTIVVECYTVYARRDGYNEPGEDWTLGMAAQDLLDVGGTKMTPLALNCTPFDAPGFGSSWIVGEKTRYRISPGNSVYLQMRDPKRKMFDTARFEYDSGAGATRVKMFKGWSRGYVLVVRSDTATPDANGPICEPFSFDCIFTKNYKYCIQSNERDAQVINS